MEYITTISSKGQITLPAKIRRELHVRPGDRLKVVKKGNSISVTPDTYQEELDELRRKAHAHLKKHGLYNLSIEEIKKRSEAARVEYYERKYGVRP